MLPSSPGGECFSSGRSISHQLEFSLGDNGV